jgi:hypothetical protein
MTRARDVSRLITTPPNIYATDSEASAGFLSLSSASSTYQTKATAGPILITPSTIVNTGGTASIGTNGTVSFSAVSNVSLNNVFSSAYDNYLIVLECNAASGNYVNFRLRVGGVDASGANYDWGFYNVTDTGTPFALAGSGATSANILRPSSSFRNMTSFTICNPAIARPTVSSGTLSYNDGATKAVAGVMGNVHSLSTAYDGFTLIHAGTITGTISVYGYNK